MPRKELIKRVPGGKTLKVEMEIKDGKIASIVFSGDFFAYPPEKFEEMEKSLVSAGLDEIEEIIESFRDEVVVVGLSFDDIIMSLKELLRD